MEKTASDLFLQDAGKDKENRTLYVCYGTYFPDPKTHSYDLFLENIKQRVDQKVENDYAVVFFASGTNYRPQVGWLLKAYRSLDRKYKKNLKKLYIVHASLWTKILIDFMKTVVSSKSKSKFHIIDSLDHLNEFIDCFNFCLPTIVQKVDKEISSKKGKSVSQEPKKYFGASLDAIMTSEKIPKVVEDMMDYLIEHGLETEGIFRKSASVLEVQRMKNKIDLNQPINFKDHDPIAVAALLKLFFRELDPPLFPVTIFPILEKIHNCSTEEMIEVIKSSILPLLSVQSKILLKNLVSLCAKVVSNSDKNLMTSTNLAVVMAPNLCRSSNVADELSTFGVLQAVFRSLIENVCDIFDQ